MTQRPSLLRRMALALMKHTARVLPSARGHWATAMQHELPQIENDLEALTWAGGCMVAGYVERAKTLFTRRWKKISVAAFLAVSAISAASWWAGQHPHLTPGNHEVFREASNAGALAGFLVFIAAAIPALAVLFEIHDRKFHDAARASRICALIIVPYLAALALVSLLTPGTVVNIGDSYCYDLWCLGVNQVNATPKGQDILYTAEVSVFVDSSNPHYLPADPAKSFFYALDDQGRRYPLLRDASFSEANVTVRPGESLKSSLAFVAPRNARKLYLMGKDAGLPWVYLYFGSDISLFHRPALLRIL
jgi:hypothetical protein